MSTISLTGSDLVRVRLLDAAGEIFADKGFRAATIREICGRAGANVAAVNYHFGDKEQLYVEAVKHAHCRQMDQPPPEWPAGTEPVLKLRGFITHLLQNLLDPNRPAWHAQLMMRELAQPTSACVALVDAYIRPMAAKLGEIIGELVPAATTPQQRSLIGFSVVSQCLFYKVHRPIIVLLVGPQQYQAFDIPHLAEHITRFSLAALGLAEPVTSPGETSPGSNGSQVPDPQVRGQAP